MSCHTTQRYEREFLSRDHTGVGLLLWRHTSVTQSAVVAWMMYLYIGDICDQMNLLMLVHVLTLCLNQFCNNLFHF